MKIFVGNLPFSVDETRLREMFAPFGEVDSANVITDRETGRPRGFGFVGMADADARKAIQELAIFRMYGSVSNVNEARAREGGGGGGRGGFGGGGGRGGGGGYR